MKKHLLLVLPLLLSTTGLGQHKHQSLKEREIRQLKVNQSQIKDFETREEREIFNNRFKSLEKEITDGYLKENFVLDTEYKKFIEQLFNQFIAQNKEYQLRKPTIYITKTNSPNAASAGFDYYFVNSGILCYLDNEYQLAAVIGHELAHNYLDHSRESIKQDAEFYREFKKERRLLKKSEMIKLIKSQDEVIQKKYDLAVLSRKKEIAADSLGFVFYTKLNFPKSEYLGLLNKLEEIDNEKFKITNDETYQQLFEVNGFKIKPKWLKLEKDELFSGLTFTEHIDKDSVKSHPNTKDRKEWVMKKFKINENKDAKIEASELFLKLKNKMIQQKYETYLHNDNYAFALYLIMQEKQENSERSDLDFNMNRILLKLYEGRLKHEFNKYVPIADANDEDQDYNRFLNFLWNIPTPDFKTIADYYNTKATL